MYGLLYECKFLTIEETNKKNQKKTIHIPNLPFIGTGISTKSGGVILKATMRLNRQKITQNPGIIYLYGKETGNSLEIKQKTITYLH
jgi:hypothetical protein